MGMDVSFFYGGKSMNVCVFFFSAEIFRSLLYEACGRIVNPIYGSAGLLWAGSWNLCQSAVEAVLSGSPIWQISAESAACTTSPPLKACDIRHVSKDENSAASAGEDLHKVKTRGKFKRTAKPKVRADSPDVDDAARVMWSWSHKDDWTFECWSPFLLKKKKVARHEERVIIISSKDVIQRWLYTKLSV